EGSSEGRRLSRPTTVMFRERRLEALIPTPCSSCSSSLRNKGKQRQRDQAHERVTGRARSRSNPAGTATLGGGWLGAAVGWRDRRWLFRTKLVGLVRAHVCNSRVSPILGEGAARRQRCHPGHATHRRVALDLPPTIRPHRTGVIAGWPSIALG